MLSSGCYSSARWASPSRPRKTEHLLPPELSLEAQGEAPPPPTQTLVSGEGAGEPTVIPPPAPTVPPDLIIQPTLLPTATPPLDGEEGAGEGAGFPTLPPAPTLAASPTPPVLTDYVPVLTLNVDDNGNPFAELYGAMPFIRYFENEGYALVLPPGSEPLQVGNERYADVLLEARLATTGGFSLDVGGFTAAVSADGLVTIRSDGIDVALERAVIVPTAGWRTVRMTVSAGQAQVAVDDVALAARVETLPTQPSAVTFTAGTSELVLDDIVISVPRAALAQAESVFIDMTYAPFVQSNSALLTQPQEALISFRSKTEPNGSITYQARFVDCLGRAGSVASFNSSSGYRQISDPASVTQISPDGRYIAFLCQVVATNTRDVCMIDLTSANPTVS